MTTYTYDRAAPLLGISQGYAVTVTYLVVDRIFSLAQSVAVVGGLADAEDVAQDFGVRWLEALKEGRSWARECTHSRPYLHRCALNFALHAAAGNRVRYEREKVLPADDNGPNLAVDHTRRPQGPKQRVLAEELRFLLNNAIAQLQPRQQEIFNRRRLKGESVINIAESLGCTPNAISVALSASRQHVAKYLFASGHSEEELREYLYEIFIED